MKKNYLTYMLLIMLAVSIFYYKIQTGTNYLPIMQEIAGQESQIQKVSGEIYEVSTAEGVVGYCDHQSAAGYAGQVDIVVFIGKDGKLKDLRIVKQVETPSFYARVLAEGFVDTLLGKEANSPFELGHDLDGVTNATYTSHAIAEAVRLASHRIAVTQFNMETPPADSFKLPLPHYLLLGLLLAVLLLQWLRKPKMRYITLLLGFLLIGLWQKSLLTLGNCSSILAGDISWPAVPFWLVLFLGVLLLIIITGRNLYCFWLCPYGALSELLGAFGKFGRLNYTPCEQSRKKFKNLRLLLAWGALVAAFIIGNPSICSYEIFAPLFAWQGVGLQWLLLPVMLFTGIFVFRFWCRFFCPVGGTLDFLVNCRRSCVQWLEKTLKKQPSRNLHPQD